WCYGYPRVLHSFPTRRSSDLVVGVDYLDRAGGRDRVPDGEHVAILVGQGNQLLAAASGADSAVHRHRAVSHGALLTGCAVCGRTDRKSTRLNSSHDQISYAVF